MVAAIKQHVTVGPEGKIEIPRSDLNPGARAEVIVLVDADAPSTPPPMTQLQALRALQDSMKLDRAAAEKWATENRILREWNRPRE